MWCWPWAKPAAGKEVPRHGRHTREDYNGSYSGEWLDGKMHGQGTYVWASGSLYDGEWREGHRNGRGTNIWADGDKYVALL